MRDVAAKLTVFQTDHLRQTSQGSQFFARDSEVHWIKRSEALS